MPRLKRDEGAEAAALARGTNYVEALARGLSVLQVFDHANSKLSLSEIARLVDLPRATVRRILFTLGALGFVGRDQKLFWLTPDVMKFARAYLTSNGLSQILQRSCEQVTSELGQACSAAILKDPEIVFIARAKPAGIVAIDLDVGYRLPAYCTSVGRVMMADLSDAALEDVLRDLEPKALTEMTVIDPDLIKAAILATRVQGYCIVDQEAETGFRSIAVPVRRQDGSIVAAINVGAHAERVSLGRMMDEFLPILRHAAQRAAELIV